jgi:hypothetical protein
MDPDFRVCSCELRTALGLAIQETAAAEADMVDISNCCRKIPLYTIIGLLAAVGAAFAFMYFDGDMKIHTHKPLIASDIPKTT